MRYVPHLILIAIVIFSVSLCSHLNADESNPSLVKPCMVCAKVYRACRSKVLTESKEDEDVVQECEDKYYACFYQHSCMLEGSR